MKATGIVRKVDELGRIVLPIELRRTMNIEAKNSLKIFVTGSPVILQKYDPTCIFGGEATKVTAYKGKNICANCRKELAQG